MGEGPLGAACTRAAWRTAGSCRQQGPRTSGASGSMATHATPVQWCMSKMSVRAESLAAACAGQQQSARLN